MRLVDALARVDLQNVIPTLAALKSVMEKAHSRLLGALMTSLRQIMNDYRSEIDDLFISNKQLAKELEFDLRIADGRKQGKMTPCLETCGASCCVPLTTHACDPPLSSAPAASRQPFCRSCRQLSCFIRLRPALAGSLKPQEAPVSLLTSTHCCCRGSPGLEGYAAERAPPQCLKARGGQAGQGGGEWPESGGDSLSHQGGGCGAARGGRRERRAAEGTQEGQGVRATAPQSVGGACQTWRVLCARLLVLGGGGTNLN